MALPSLNDVKIAVIGLGYVGLPLAAHFGRRFQTIGFDIDLERVEQLRAGIDRTRELSANELEHSDNLSLTTSADDLKSSNFFVITVPTPIDSAKRPDLAALKSASTIVGEAISEGDIVVYESTVYPGATEEECVPVLERVSGLTHNSDFFTGYSPERINPGDKQHPLPAITKITSGSTAQAGDIVDSVYSEIITAGTHRVKSIKAAEAAKVIENIQRDLNIALVNELAMLFKRLDIDTEEVLTAAKTKWNFHNYSPGLVGGHCIGVDPYYLTHKALTVGFHPEVILAGRRINDTMSEFVAHEVISLMLHRKMQVGAARLLVMGVTFKADCPDVRNTKVVDLVRELSRLVQEVVVFDPYADADEIKHEYGMEIVNEMPEAVFDGIILAVKHSEFVAMGQRRIRELLATEEGFIYDIKGVLPNNQSDARL